MTEAMLSPSHASGANLPAHTLSIVVPLYNEAQSIEPLLDRIEATFEAYPSPWEVVLVDDGSIDATASELARSAKLRGEHIHVVELVRNYRQTAAMQAGIDAARGSVIATMDGDLQNDPADIPRMVARLLGEDLDLVAGWRRNRKEGFLLRRFPSRVANWLIARATGIRLNDYGCSLKVFRGSVIKSIRLYGEMHRFIPAWMATVTTPRRIAEEVVTHHARSFGKSNYGLSRTFRVILDLIFVFFFLRYRTRPGHFFGGVGLTLFGVGSVILAYMLGLKLFLDEDIGTRPLLFSGFFLWIIGVQLILTGLLAELLTRIYHESGHAPAYKARPRVELDEGQGWFTSKP
jgi:glycosyltransferase involved in cell wall biosynthesis